MANGASPTRGLVVAVENAEPYPTTVFEVTDGAVLIGKKIVSLRSVRHYLESRPEKLPFHDE